MVDQGASLHACAMLSSKKSAIVSSMPKLPSQAVAVPLGLFAAMLVGLGVTACGGTSGKATSLARNSSRPVGAISSTAAHRTDFDNDADHNDDDGKVLAYGRAAGTAERGIATALVKRYYAAAAADDGARACRLLVPLLAEIAAEANEHVPATQRTCPIALARLFRVHHSLLVHKSTSLEVFAIRLKGERMLVVMQFPPLPEARQIEERKVGGVWKIFSILDGIIE